MSSLLEFPCRFSVKAIGRGDDLETLVCSIIDKHASAPGEKVIRNKPSKQKRYQAITVTIMAHNQEELDAIYSELSAHPQVVMAL